MVASVSEDRATGMLELMHELYPILRSPAGPGTVQTLEILQRETGLQIERVASGTQVGDWEVPSEWHIDEAYVEDASGRRWIDLRDHTLHVVNYSRPFVGELSGRDLASHLHTCPELPHSIPYRTSYYQDDWGFCLSEATRQRMMSEGVEPFRVVMSSRLVDGHLSWGELVLPGREEPELLVTSHICHPSLANDNLSGVVSACALIRWLRQQERRWTYRFVFAPGTLGAIVWMDRNREVWERIRGGWVLAMVGDDGPLTYKRSRLGTSWVDRTWDVGQVPNCIEYVPTGYDERQFNSPGSGLPMGRLSRADYGTWPFYHTSADDLEGIDAFCLQASVQALIDWVTRLEDERFFSATQLVGEPQLGRRGLWASPITGLKDDVWRQAVSVLLGGADGETPLSWLAAGAGMASDVLERVAERLLASNLLQERWRRR